MEEYTYFVPVKSYQHFLYAKELTKLFVNKYHWKTVNGKSCNKLVSAYLQDCEHSDSRVNTPTYYSTRHGLMRVYPYGLEYIETLNDSLHIERCGFVESGTIKINETKYTVVRCY